MFKTKIAGIGYSVPERVVTNHDLEQLMETSDDWIVSRTGIQERRWVAEGQGTSDLAVEAARRALDDARVTPREVDLVICATLTSDYFFPGIGAQVQHQLGLETVGAFDIKAACSAFIYALACGDQFIKTGQCRNVLIIGAEVQSTALNVTTEGRDMSVLFGDGAGAALLQPTDGESYILSTHLHCDGRYIKELWCEAPASRLHPRLSQKMLEEGRHYPQMNGREVFRHAIVRFPEVIREALETNGLTLDDLAQVIPHQANLRITQMVARRLGVTMDKVYSNIHKYGNTTGASIPIALCEAYSDGKFTNGEVIILAAFGSGFTWASAAVRW